jgi:hypothetical protein
VCAYVQSAFLPPDFLQVEFDELVLDVFGSILFDFGLLYPPLHCKWVLFSYTSSVGLDFIGVKQLFIH